jgi:hypothetical protein
MNNAWVLGGVDFISATCILFGLGGVVLALFCILITRSLKIELRDMTWRFDRLSMHYTKIHPKPWIDEGYNGSLAGPIPDPRWRPGLNDDSAFGILYQPENDPRENVRRALPKRSDS